MSSLSFRGADEVREPGIHIHQAGDHCNGTSEKEKLDPGFAAEPVIGPRFAWTFDGVQNDIGEFSSSPLARFRLA